MADTTLPPGFVLDPPTAAPAPPPGFVLDNMPQTQSVSPIQLQNQAQSRTRNIRMQGQLPGELRTTTNMADVQVPAEQKVPFGTRFDTARNTYPVDIIKKLQAKLPGADIRQIEDPDTKGALYAIRMPGERDYALLDSPGLVNMGDAADVAGGLFNAETAGTIIGAFATKGRTLLGRIGGQVAGAVAGKTLDLGVESARGYQQGGYIEGILNEAPTSALGAAGGELVGSGLVKLGRALTGRGLASLTPAEREAQALAVAQGTTLYPGDVNPLLGKVTAQIEQTSKYARGQLLVREGKLLEGIKEIRDGMGNPESLTDDGLRNYLQASKDIILSAVKNPNLPPEVAGQALKEGRDLYVRATKAQLKTLYDKALALGQDAEFDLTPVQQLALELKAGIKAKAKAGEKSDSQLLAEELAQEFGGAVPEEKAREAFVRIAGVKGELGDIVDKILAMDPNVASFEGNSAFEQIKALRTELFDLKNASIYGYETNENRKAGQLWGALTMLMDNPQGGDAAFKTALRQANEAYIKHEKVLDVADIKRIANESNPAALMRSMATPYKGPTLSVLREILPPEKWQEFKQGYITQVLAEPEKIATHLDNWRGDPYGLRTLLSEGEEASLRTMGDMYQELQAEPIKAVLKADAVRMNRGRAMIESLGPEQLGAFINRVGGKNAKEVEGIKFGLMDIIRERAEVTRNGVQVLDPGRAAEAITELLKSGKAQAVLQPSEVNSLMGLRALYSITARKGKDVGAGMQGAEVGAQVASVASPLGIFNPANWYRTAKGVEAATRNAFQARMLYGQVGARAVAGAGRATFANTEAALRATTAVIGETMLDLERQLSGETQPQPAVGR